MTADRIRSRREADAVPALLRALDVAGAESPGHLVLPFERTVGDEVQGLTDDPAVVVDAILTMTRIGGWRIGIGIGPVDHPLPDSTRAASGPAYLAAREAITSARGSAVDLRVVAAEIESVGALAYGGAERARLAEAVLAVTVSLMRRRTKQGWDVVTLLDHGMTGREAASALGVSTSAVSQRARVAARQEVNAALAAASVLLAQADLVSGEATS